MANQVHEKPSSWCSRRYEIHARVALPNISGISQHHLLLKLPSHGASSNTQALLMLANLLWDPEHKCASPLGSR